MPAGEEFEQGNEGNESQHEIDDLPWDAAGLKRHG
jgi:hypothetical protein